MLNSHSVLLLNRDSSDYSITPAVALSSFWTPTLKSSKAIEFTLSDVRLRSTVHGRICSCCRSLNMASVEFRRQQGLFYKSWPQIRLPVISTNFIQLQRVGEAAKAVG